MITDRKITEVFVWLHASSMSMDPREAYLTIEEVKKKVTAKFLFEVGDGSEFADAWHAFERGDEDSFSDEEGENVFYRVEVKSYG